MADPSVAFPVRDSLCEHCGYPLQGLNPTGDCPECGTPIAASDPSHRTGLPWQNRMSFTSWLQTAWWIAARPTQAFGLLRLGGSNTHEQCFLLIHALVIAAGWAAFAWWRDGRWFAIALHGVIALMAVCMMTYIEVLGVTYFSWRRGWRVPWALAERIACYASPAWIPAATVLAAFSMMERASVFAPLLSRLGPHAATGYLIGNVVLLGVSMLGFETLVWIGVRRTRFANAAAS